MQPRCEYCGHQPTSWKALEARNGKIVCRNVKACDARDEASHKANLARLRKLKRAGEELTEAERQELADG